MRGCDPTQGEERWVGRGHRKADMLRGSHQGWNSLGTTLREWGPHPTFPQPGVPGPGPDSRVTGLGDEGAQLLDPVVNVESPATFNYGGRREKELSTGQGGKRRNWGVGKLWQ